MFTRTDHKRLGIVLPYSALLPSSGLSACVNMSGPRLLPTWLLLPVLLLLLSLPGSPCYIGQVN